MRTNIQVRRYASLAQVDQDLRLIEPAIARIEVTCSRIDAVGSLTRKQMSRYVSAVEHSANLHRVMSNVRSWVDHASIKEGPKNVEAKLASLNKRLANANNALRKCGGKTYKPSRELRAVAGTIKLFADSLLVNNFENASTAVLLLVDRETHSPLPVIQTAYRNVIDQANFKYPELFISIAGDEGAYEVGFSRSPSLFKSGRYNNFTDVEVAKLFIQHTLNGMNVCKRGT